MRKILIILFAVMTLTINANAVHVIKFDNFRINSASAGSYTVDWYLYSDDGFLNLIEKGDISNPFPSLFATGDINDQDGRIKLITDYLTDWATQKINAVAASQTDNTKTLAILNEANVIVGVDGKGTLNQKPK